MPDKALPTVPSRPHRSPFLSLLVGIMGTLMAVYLLNLTFGVDLLPDNLPLIGNIDEAIATTILLSCLAFFGIELPWLRKRSV